MNELLKHSHDLSPDDYCVLGLATCFIRDEEEILPIQVIEPIPSFALSALLQGTPTSYERVCAKSLEDILNRNKEEFPPEAQFCPAFGERTITAARTYKQDTQVKSLLPIGTLKTDFNLSLERKRVLNSQDFVKPEKKVPVTDT